MAQEFILKKSMNRETTEQLIKLLTLSIKECEYLLNECKELHFIDKCIIKRHIRALKNKRNFYIDVQRGLSW